MHTDEELASIPSRTGSAHAPGLTVCALGLAAAILLLGTSPAGAQSPAVDPAATAPAATAPPADDLARWTEIKERSGVRALPYEARLLYRRGLLAHRAGHRNEAVRLVRGAADLDATFVAPRLTLAGWMMPREPGQALLQVAGLVEVVRRDFTAQWTLSANAALVLVRVLFFTVIAAGMVLLLFRQGELRHWWRERPGGSISRPTAHVWSWVLLLAPFALGFGVVLPLVGLLAMAWHGLKIRERVLVVSCVVSAAALPFANGVLDRMAAPMRDREVVARLVALETEPYTAARHRELAELAAQHPEDPYLQFGAGWVARQAGDLRGAEDAYRRTLALWPGDARVLNNLGSALALQQRFPEAINAYREAADADSTDAASLMNLSRALTHEFDFDGANAARSRATAIDFDFVRAHPDPGDDGVLHFVDRWLAPATLWRAVQRAAPTGDLVPGLPHAGPEGQGGWFTLAVLLVAMAGFLYGRTLQRRLPISHCRNCGSVVCRRCAQRRNAEALCPACASVEAGAPSPAFAAVLLHRERDRRRRPRELAEAAIAFLVPGAGLLAHRRVVRALLLLFFGIAAVIAAVSDLPYAAHPRLGFGAPDGRLGFAFLLLPVYLLSILGYLGERARTRTQHAARGRNAPPRKPPLRIRDSHADSIQEAA